MKINLKLGKNYDKFMAAMRKAPDQMDKAIQTGVQDALHDAANAVVSSPLMTSGGTQGLFVRSGDLRRAIHNYPDTESRWHGFVGTGDREKVEHYSWLLGDEQHVIKPTEGRKFLAIPIGDNKTQAGVGGNLFASPRDAEDGFFFKSKAGNLLFGDTVGDKVRTLFMLLPSVLVQGRGILPDVMEAQEPKIKRTIHNSISKVFKKLNLSKN